MTTITINPSIKGDIAEKIVEQAHPGYSAEYMGAWFTDGDRLYHRESHAPWNPWSDDAVVVAVDDLIDLSAIDPDPSVDWSVFRDQIETWRAGLDLGADEDDREVIAKARESEQFKQQVEAIEGEAEYLAVELVLGELPETYEAEEVE